MCQTVDSQHSRLIFLHQYDNTTFSALHDGCTISAECHNLRQQCHWRCLQAICSCIHGSCINSHSVSFLYSIPCQTVHRYLSLWCRSDVDQLLLCNIAVGSAIQHKRSKARFFILLYQLLSLHLYDVMTKCMTLLVRFVAKAKIKTCHFLHITHPRKWCVWLPVLCKSTSCNKQLLQTCNICSKNAL